MISLKSNGDGTTTILAYMNDTLLVYATGGALTASTAAAWPFQSQLGGVKDNGLSVWSLFGTKTTFPIFDKVNVYSTTPGVGGTPPTLANVVAALRSVTGFIPGLPDLFNFLTNQYAQMTQPQMITRSEFTGNGGISNAPSDNATGGVTGYVGNVGELWIKAGTFIDWTNADQPRLHARHQRGHGPVYALEPWL